MNIRRVIPSIEQLRQRDSVRVLEARYGLRPVVDALREEAEALREGIEQGAFDVADRERAAAHIERELEERLAAALSPSLRAVINATGVIIHTNLGRAPLPPAAIQRIAEVAAGYSTLEYDLATGDRGSRSTHAARLLCRLTGAHAATVVNNNAAGLLLVLSALAEGREVIISRGELVEIGGGFRIPDVLRQSGARIREVGTTNRTRPEDYGAAVNSNTALILRVHPSNFKLEGFAERPSLSSVVDMGRRLEVPVVEDLGSGNLRSELGQPPIPHHEPTVRESLDAGVTVCCFSGDKMLGGPQAGIIVGDQTSIDTIARHPLMRALRADKLVYAALEATLLEHLTGRAPDTVPVERMINLDVNQLIERANRIVGRVTETAPSTGLTVAAGRSAIGGGTTPGVSIPSCLLEVEIANQSPRAVEACLRASEPAVIGRIEDGRVCLDLRTVQPEQDDALADVLIRLLAGEATAPHAHADGAR